MAARLALLLLVWGSLAASQPELWPPARQSSPGSGGIITTQPRRNNVPSAVRQGVILRALLPTYHCWFSYFSRCPRTVTSSRRRSLAKESLDARSVKEIVKQAVLQALGGRYMAGYKHLEYKETTTNPIKMENSRIKML